MKNKHSLRALLSTASIAGVLLLAHVGAINAADAAIPEVLWNSDFLIETYGPTDWSQVTSSVVSHPDDPDSAKVFLIPLALGNAFIDRYEVLGDESDSERALQYFLAVTGGHWIWEKDLMAPVIAHALVVSVNRMRRPCAEFRDLPRVQRKRAGVLWSEIKSILKSEADYRLAVSSSEATGGPNAWDAALFADAATFLPDDANATAWNDRARELVYTSLNPSDDPLLANGDEIEEILLARRQVTLPARSTGEPILVTFRPIIDELSVEGDPEADYPEWKVPADHSDIVKVTRLRKSFRRYVSKPVAPVPVMTPGSDLVEAVQNSKSVLYSVLASSVSHLPTEPECQEVLYTMPEDGEVQ